LIRNIAGASKNAFTKFAGWVKNKFVPTPAVEARDESDTFWVY
jgi:hypothetical protein